MEYYKVLKNVTQEKKGQVKVVLNVRFSLDGTVLFNRSLMKKTKV